MIFVIAALSQSNPTSQNTEKNPLSLVFHLVWPVYSKTQYKTQVFWGQYENTLSTAPLSVSSLSEHSQHM